MVPYGWRRISTVCRFEYHQNLFYRNLSAESAPFVVEQWIRYLFLFLNYYSWKPLLLATYEACKINTYS